MVFSDSWAAAKLIGEGNLLEEQNIKKSDWNWYGLGRNSRKKKKKK